MTFWTPPTDDEDPVDALWRLEFEAVIRNAESRPAVTEVNDGAAQEL